VTARATCLSLVCALCAALLSGCQKLSAVVPGANANAARAIELASRHGCVSCHDIPGAAVTGRVGPTLRGLNGRAYLAGGLPNTPEQIVAFIRFPERARPGTLMPNLRVSESDARELATFLYTLR
jgi:cytochrome c551/c552